MILSTRILTTDCVDSHRNLAMEEALLTAPDSRTTATLFLWQNRHTVVIGAGQNAFSECRTQLLRDEGGTLARRSSGGGAVYHDLGNLNFSFIVPRADYDVKRQLGVVLSAVRRLGVDAQATGRNDLTCAGRKFSGNAFRLLKASALHHGTLLIDVDMSLIGRYLNVPEDKLRAKGVKSVHARVVNLSQLRAQVNLDAMRQAMMDAFCAEYGGARPQTARGEDIPGFEALLPKYESWAWNLGASPAGEMNLQRRFDWGGVTLNFQIVHGHMQKVAVYTDAMDETLSPRLAALLEGAPFDGSELARRAAALESEDLSLWLSSLES